jgi:hypothetical protein
VDSSTEKSSAVRNERRDKFYRTMAGVLLLTVLVGFSPKFFLRPLFDVPDVPALDVYVHGAIMTGWFLLFFVQTSLVLAGRTPLHHRMGVFGAFLGVAVFVSAIAVNVKAVAWSVDRGFDLAIGSQLLWLDFGAMIAFGPLFTAAIFYRKRVEVHKRLMLLASISMIGPATSRIVLWPIFDMSAVLFYAVVFYIGGIVLFLAAPVIHELLDSRRANIVTLLGGLYVLIVAVLFPYVIFRTDFALEFIRSLA